jgi:hypothetical protein
MRFEDVLSRSERSELNQIEAAELLGISERTFPVGGVIAIARVGLRVSTGTQKGL